jgi:hypothetical protein
VRAFVVPDLHGQTELMLGLLRAAGIATPDGLRTEETAADTVISVGDLINGVMADWSNDEDILKRADGLVDLIVLGNHEHPYYGGLPFSGFSPSPAVRSALYAWELTGRVVHEVVIGDTLITHAGVHAKFRFGTAVEAAAAIEDVWDNYESYATVRMSGPQYTRNRDFGFVKPNGKQYALPMGSLVDGMSEKRGGWLGYGGVLWSDWSEPKNTAFSQVLGHTPVETGPVLIQHLKSEKFTLNLDTGAKGGKSPVGVWLDADGEIIDFVEVPDGESD